MQSIDFPTLLTTTYVLVDDWYIEESVFYFSQAGVWQMLLELRILLLYNEFVVFVFIKNEHSKFVNIERFPTACTG